MFSAAFDLSQRQTYGSGLAYPSVGDTASASVGRELSQTGAMITRRNLNVQPTIKVPVGYNFTVRVNRDILFDSVTIRCKPIRSRSRRGNASSAVEVPLLQQ